MIVPSDRPRAAATSVGCKIRVVGSGLFLGINETPLVGDRDNIGLRKEKWRPLTSV
jgi:hypothetical protein